MTSTHSESVPSATFKKVGECLYRLESTGGYYALLKRGGKQFRRSLKTRDRKLAERRLGALKQEIANLVISDDAKLTFKDIAERWLSSIRHTLKPKSASRLEICIKGMEPFFRGLAIRNIKRQDAERWLTSRGPKIAAQTFNHELGAMRNIFNYAVSLGLMLDNPARDISRRPVRQARISIPTAEQFKQLVAAIRQNDGRLDSQRKATSGADLVELLGYSGMRLREATSLRWRDVDFDRNTITIRGPDDVGTKNSESRTIPMPDALRELLTSIKAHRQPEPKPDDFISLINDAKKCLNTACRKLGFPHFTHHDFRHFFATTCIESGVDIPTISRWLGHKDGGALAMKVYGHLRQEHSFAMIKRVNFGSEPPAENVVPMAASGSL